MADDSFTPEQRAWRAKFIEKLAALCGERRHADKTFDQGYVRRDGTFDADLSDDPGAAAENEHFYWE